VVFTLNSGATATFLDLQRYHPHPEDNSVIAWATDHTGPEHKSGQRDINFRIKAMSIELSPQQRARRQEYDRMIKGAVREARKSDRGSRGKRSGHEADEL